MSSRARDFLPGLNVSRRSLLSRRSRRSTASSTCQQPKDGTTDDSDIESDDLSFYHDNENCFRKLSQTQSEEQVHKFLDAIINDSRETKFDRKSENREKSGDYENVTETRGPRSIKQLLELRNSKGRSLEKAKSARCMGTSLDDPRPERRRSLGDNMPKQPSRSFDSSFGEAHPINAVRKKRERRRNLSVGENGPLQRRGSSRRSFCKDGSIRSFNSSIGETHPMNDARQKRERRRSLNSHRSFESARHSQEEKALRKRESRRYMGEALKVLERANSSARGSIKAIPKEIVVFH